jgi:hypothetical protein
MSEHPIETLHGHEFSTMLITERIPFRTTYDEYLTWFHIEQEHLKAALDLMMKLRASKL